MYLGGAGWSCGRVLRGGRTIRLMDGRVRAVDHPEIWGWGSRIRMPEGSPVMESTSAPGRVIDAAALDQRDRMGEAPQAG